MMRYADIRVYTTAADLPAEWNVMAPHFFMRTPVLQVLEQTQPCGQRYYLATGGAGVAMAVTYRHRLPLLVGRGREILPVPVRMVGIPCSVSASGYHVQGAPASVLAEITKEGGLTLVMNAQDCRMERFATGRSLPSWILPVCWADREDYLRALRSPYRRRISQAMQQWGSVETRALPRGAFEAKHYALYEAVHARSRYKIEKLNLSFFQQFPADVDVFEVGGQPIGFVQTVQEGNSLTFMFGGMDYAQRDRFDLYWNMLLHVVTKGIEKGCREIDLGQTAGSVKARLGAVPSERWFHVRHRSRILQAILGRLVPVLAYQGNDAPQTMHVFHKQTDRSAG